ncbi:MAG: helix-hairpin-helix domain-containing protein [Longimicrobiales bacterium]|nr:helix-hairpin-helix domain-containing protein [Longimicrobiales bacterium]
MGRKPTTGLESIPGIGPSLARDLRDLGFHEVEDLRGVDPEEMYARLIRLRGHHQDRCVLYAFRCAAYYATEREPDPALLEWWAWKDRTSGWT